MDEKFTLVIHGGAGTITLHNGPAGIEKEREYRQTIQQALNIGADILRRDGSALDAVVAAVKLLEDSPLFNAGKGAVYTNTGAHELDASVMEGRYRRAGAVTCVSRLKNPVLAALKVMECSCHVLLSGRGAEDFAAQAGCELVENVYFDTPHRLQQLVDTQRKESEARKTHTQLDHADAKGSSSLPYSPLELASSSCSSSSSSSASSSSSSSFSSTSSSSSSSSSLLASKFGTVGAVARDKYGNLAAATSTGGMTNKRFNRVGDSPIIGAGTYADNATCAVSCTGYGEYFMRGVTAFDMSALMEYKGLSVAQAADFIVRERMNKFHLPHQNPFGPASGSHGSDSSVTTTTTATTATTDDALIEFRGGLIAVDGRGLYAFPFNSTGMYRGVVTQSESPRMLIWSEEFEKSRTI